MNLDLESIAVIEKRAAVKEARSKRLDALAAKLLRRRATRSKIVLGGAILAELREHPEDAALLNRIVAILDDRVSRGRDRDDLRELLLFPIPANPAPVASSYAGLTLPDFDAVSDAAPDTALQIPRSESTKNPEYADVKKVKEPHKS